MPKEYLTSQTVLGNIPIAESIIYFDNFESALQWQSAGNGTDYRADVVSDRSMTGAYCMDLITRSAFASGDNVAGYRDFFLPVSQRVRLVCHFMIVSLTNTATIEFQLQHTAGATDTYKRFEVRFSTADNRWEYYDGTNWVIIPGMTQYLFDTGWNRISFDVDFSNAFYLKLEVNNKSASMSTIAPSTGSDSTGERLRIQIKHTSTTSGRSEVLIDDVLLQAL